MQIKGKLKAENVMNQKSDYDLPISFFYRSSKAAQPQTKHIKNGKNNSQGIFASQPWLVDDEWTALWTLEGIIIWRYLNPCEHKAYI